MHYSIPITLENTQNWFMKNVDKQNRGDVIFCESTSNRGWVRRNGRSYIDRQICQ